jgi:hypothetical protein
VRQLKGITATYRMTSKGPPTRHSHYVSGVLQPLRAALDAPGPPQRLPAGLRGALAAAVFDSVNARYQQLAEELLSSVRKTESSLRRLKKGRGPEAGAADGAAAEMSDSEKICLQLYLDAQEHGRQAARFGLDPSAAASFQALLAVVTPAAGASGGGSQPQSPVVAARPAGQSQQPQPQTYTPAGGFGAAPVPPLYQPQQLPQQLSQQQAAAPPVYQQQHQPPQAPLGQPTRL